MKTVVTDFATAARAAEWLTGSELTALRHALRGAGRWLDARPAVWNRVRGDLLADTRALQPDLDPDEVIVSAVTNLLRIELHGPIRDLLNGGPVIRSARDLQCAAERLGAETAQRLFTEGRLN